MPAVHPLRVTALYGLFSVQLIAQQAEFFYAEGLCPATEVNAGRSLQLLQGIVSNTDRPERVPEGLSALRERRFDEAEEEVLVTDGCAWATADREGDDSRIYLGPGSEG